jgi:hypothetical protein
MEPAPTLVEGRAASSLGERLYSAMLAVARDANLPTLGDVPFWRQPAGVQVLYELGAVRFVARLTYAESEGTREALLSSLLLAELKKAERFIAGFEGDPLQEGVDALLAETRAAIAQAEGRARDPEPA